jgi:octaprenyl-diphosphate synthase
LVETKNSEVLTLFSEITQEICKGEIEQFTNKTVLSQKSYIERAKRKTGMLFKLCTEGACLISDNKLTNEAADYALNLGIAFQICDDLLLFKDNYTEKTTDADFENATLTLPVIFAAEDGISPNFGGDFDDFKQKIKNTGAIDKSYKTALKYKQRAIENLACFEDNEYRKSLLDLAEYVTDREF